MRPFPTLSDHDIPVDHMYIGRKASASIPKQSLVPKELAELWFQKTFPRCAEPVLAGELMVVAQLPACWS